MKTVAAPKDETIERLVTMFRERLESAIANGQRVRMSARDGGSSKTMPMDALARRSLVDLLSDVEPDGSFELHVYIEPKR